MLVLARQNGIRDQLVPRALNINSTKNNRYQQQAWNPLLMQWSVLTLWQTSCVVQQQYAYQVGRDTLLGHLLLPRICQQCRQGGAVAEFPVLQPQDREAACTNNTLLQSSHNQQDANIVFHMQLRESIVDANTLWQQRDDFQQVCMHAKAVGRRWVVMA